jgi:Helix-turn-helix domain
MSEQTTVQSPKIAAQRVQDYLEATSLHGQRLLTTEEVAEILGVPPSAVEACRHQGRIRTTTLPDGRIRYLPSHVVEFMNQPAGGWLAGKQS